MSASAISSCAPSTDNNISNLSNSLPCTTLLFFAITCTQPTFICIIMGIKLTLISIIIMYLGKTIKSLYLSHYTKYFVIVSTILNINFYTFISQCDKDIEVDTQIYLTDALVNSRLPNLMFTHKL